MPKLMQDPSEIETAERAEAEAPESMEQEDMEQEQPAGGQLDPDREIFEQIVAGLIKHIFGKGEEGIKAKLRESQDLPRDIGSLTFTMVEQATLQAKDAGVELDMDILMGVAAEIIDSLLQLAEAIGLIETADDDDLREESMMSAVEAYITMANPSEEERQAAQQLLDQMSESGEVDEAASVIQQIGKKRGIDPFEESVAVDSGGAPAQPAAGQPRQLMQE